MASQFYEGRKVVTIINQSLERRSENSYILGFLLSVPVPRIGFSAVPIARGF